MKGNHEKELVKEVIMPALNPFGYYEIDITDLPSGTYKINVLDKGEWLEHKIETFN